LLAGWCPPVLKIKKTPRSLHSAGVSLSGDFLIARGGQLVDQSIEFCLDHPDATRSKSNQPEPSGPDKILPKICVTDAEALLNFARSEDAFGPRLMRGRFQLRGSHGRSNIRR
jgi:hypothetical protein